MTNGNTLISQWPIEILKTIYISVRVNERWISVKFLLYITTGAYKKKYHPVAHQKLYNERLGNSSEQTIMYFI